MQSKNGQIFPKTKKNKFYYKSFYLITHKTYKCSKCLNVDNTNVTVL